jgi:hypothetical protein
MIPTDTTKLKVRATVGPQNCCCCRLAPSDVLRSEMRLARRSSSAIPAITIFQAGFSNFSLLVHLCFGVMVMLDDRIWMYSLAKRKALFHASLLVHLFCIVFFS